MKTILRSPLFTVVLFILAAALLGFGTVGAVQAAPRIQSRDYRAEIVLTDIHTALCESSKATDGLDDFIVRNGDDGLHIDPEIYPDDNMIKNNGDTSLKLGKKYVERLAARNTVTRSVSERKQAEPIPEYVRVTVRTYWAKVDDKGNIKQLDVDPSLIKLEYVTDNGWTIDEAASTDERTVLYYDKVLQPGETSTEFVKSLTIDPAVATAVAKLDGSYDYEGMKFYIDARVDAVQDHHGEAAMKSAWGRTNTGY